MKRILVLMLLLSLFLFAGCGQSSPTPSESSTAPTEEKASWPTKPIEVIAPYALVETPASMQEHILIPNWELVNQ